MGSDVFGAAYPCSGRVRLMEMYAERYFRPRGAMPGVRAGRFRMPFGIDSRSDHGYSGFLRPPLIRYDGYVGISNNWLEDASTRGNPYLPPRFAVGRQAFSGADVRWAHPSGLQARGEFLKGHSYEGVSTTGWYVDGIIHRPGMGAFTAVIRGEQMDR